MTNDPLRQAYDADTFRTTGHALIDELADWLASSQTPAPDTPVVDYREPADTYTFWQEQLQQADAPLWQNVLQQSMNVHHPRYMGHQISPPLPVAALAGLVSDLLNNGMAVYEMGMAGTATERVVIETVARALGFSDRAGGFLTSGGTLANLTALLAARAHRAPHGVWQEGSREPLALLVSEQAHYCVDRAARIMGWGEAGVVKVPCNEHYAMRTELLESQYQAAQAAGRTVIAVVGSACTTATGSFDDLLAIADFCEKYKLWFHVDGAHGAPLALSPEYRHRVAGLERADSVAMDFHKMLLTPSIITALFYKEHRASYATFQQRANYLMEGEAEDDWSNLARRTFECTKLMAGFKVYTILQQYGTSLWTEYVTRVCRLGETFSQLIAEHPDFELLLPAQCNIVCFRHLRPESPATALNEHNRRLRRRLLEEGRFYIVQTEVDNKVWLRTTITNPFTTADDLRALLAYLPA